jgi:hypothetical protein
MGHHPNYKVATPAETSPVGADLDGLPFNETWDYASLVGIIIYLASHTQSDIAYALHQSAIYSHGRKNSHASVKSRTGYVIKFCNVPILWVSKMQTQISLSTMEAEYIALSQSTRDLIPIRERLKEIMLEIFDEKLKPECITHSKAFQDGTPSKDELIPQSDFFEDNMACMNFAQMPKLSPRTKHLSIPLHWYRSKLINLEIIIRPYQVLRSSVINSKKDWQENHLNETKCHW